MFPALRLPVSGMLVFVLMSTLSRGSGGTPERHRNRLASESSPYLLQHQNNPVDWYPWGEEALEAARKADCPIFLSIGYSTCHWCHVMEHESFENDEIATLMNRDFVSIKVDREERPDLDNVYMTACQLMTRSGGWPLTVILTPDGRPFFAGTYFPPDDRYGRAGMKSLLPGIARAWKTQRQEIEQQATALAGAVREAVASPPSRGIAPPLDRGFADSLLDELASRFDPARGGFSAAPKFPPHGALAFLLWRARRGRSPKVDLLLRKTLDEMQEGGIFDQVGGGFHRYSVDADWFLPHFEKMLYDNAQLLEIYAGAARLYGDERYRETALRIADWLERDMRTPEGGYAAALDADSEGVEGKYYLWTAGELEAVLGTEAFALYAEAFGIRAGGNCPPHFEEGRGKNLPRGVGTREEIARRHRLTVRELSEALLKSQTRLEAARRPRVPPARDDKVITSWNALAVSALARASRDLNEPRLESLARRLADFLLRTNVAGDRVFHVSRSGKAKINGFLDDYALLSRALLDLSEVSGAASDAARARDLARSFVAQFHDDEGGGFYQTAGRGPRSLLDSSREFLDQVLPSPNAVAAEVLQRLSAREPDRPFSRAAEDTLRAAAAYADGSPAAAASFAILASGIAPATTSLPASRKDGPVAVSASLRESEIRAGGDATLIVRLAMDPGWHVQSHDSPGEEVVPTVVTLSAPDGLEAGEPAYPEGRKMTVGEDELSVYSGTVEVATRIHAGREARAGEMRLRVRVAYQPCDDSRCLEPRHADLAVFARIVHP